MRSPIRSTDSVRIWLILTQERFGVPSTTDDQTIDRQGGFPYAALLEGRP